MVPMPDNEAAAAQAALDALAAKDKPPEPKK
jgi:hypothetical protein